MNIANPMVTIFFPAAVVFSLASTVVAQEPRFGAGDKGLILKVDPDAAFEMAKGITRETDDGDLQVHGKLDVDKRLLVHGPVELSAKAIPKGTDTLTVLGTTVIKSRLTTVDLIVKGSATLQQLTVPSSRRWKYDISGLAGPDALALLKGLKPVAFKLKGDRSGVSHLGFVAEEMPTALAGPDGQTYRPFEVIAVLTKALQEQQRMIQALQEQVGR